jgi:5'-3' exoribonuclease 1
VVLDELALTEKESFEKENMDMNWFKGKQSKHIQIIEETRKKGPQSKPRLRPVCVPPC